MSAEVLDLPEPDRLEGVPHPRHTPRLFGQDAAERSFLAAHAAGRLHHGWLLTGPRGVGKATLAWRIARFLLAQPAEGHGGLFGGPETPASLDIDPEHPVARRVAALSEPGLFLLRRGVNASGSGLSDAIRVEEVRKLRSFFALSNAEGGQRVVIIDAADEMNTNAANAVLKLLEEPPPRATLLLVSHQPARLLPTIRSRCRTLPLAPLGEADLAAALEQAGVEAEGGAGALAALSGGSVGAAVALAQGGGAELYADLVRVLASLPRLDRAAAIALSERAAGQGAEARRDLLFDLIEHALARLALAGATGRAPAPEAAPGEAETLRRLSPDAQSARGWAELAPLVGGRLRHGRAVNLDPASLILDTLHSIADRAR
ncbi:DNA polymerase III subunit delta' [Rhodosalinus halophilus]|uniref:DNA polymerase III subunit delta n=1 Tax=Rhodosalinus halophilus TaxID=2259333 RepID=A0A365U487_9RHOB|nr:DNA polymerase III subunit delta' [Rhodosalinus halophilus]RBI82916.1 DNA polymerase III subunit delta' [Rhodosalinus halophilus]